MNLVQKLADMSCPFKIGDRVKIGSIEGFEVDAMVVSKPFERMYKRKPRTYVTVAWPDGERNAQPIDSMRHL